MRSATRIRATRRSEFCSKIFARRTAHRARSTIFCANPSTDKAKPASVDLKAIDRILQTVSPEFQGINNFLVGLFLKNHGKAEDARRYLKTAVESPGLHEWWQAIAAEALRNLEDGKNAVNPGDATAKKTN